MALSSSLMLGKKALADANGSVSCRYTMYQNINYITGNSTHIQLYMHIAHTHTHTRDIYCIIF